MLQCHTSRLLHCVWHDSLQLKAAATKYLRNNPASTSSILTPLIKVHLLSLCAERGIGHSCATCMQMYAAIHIFYFSDEMNALLAMSTFHSVSGVVGFFLSVIFDALVHTGNESAALRVTDSAIDHFLHFFSPTFLAMRLLSGVMSRKSAENDWSLSQGDGGTILWLVAQFALNVTVLMICTSGLLADILHIAETSISKHVPWLSPSLAVLEAGEQVPEGEESGGLARGPSRPILFSQVCVLSSC